MENPAAEPVRFPHRASSPSGISAELNGNGSVRRMDAGGVMLNLFLGNELEGGLAALHLRRLGETVETTALIGPAGPSVHQMEETGMIAAGQAGGLRFRVRLVLAQSATAWFWQVEVENPTEATVEFDLIHTQDVGIADYGAVRLNEFYVAQYIDHTPLEHPVAGVAVASRQNQAMGGRNPWTVIGSLGTAVSYATDALQVHGLAARDGAAAPGLSGGLPGERLQHEHSLVAIQQEAVALAAGETWRGGFFGYAVADHPEATGDGDLQWIDAALALPEAACGPIPEPAANPMAASLFTTAPFLQTVALDEAELARHFGPVRLHGESGEGRLLSFFTAEGGHVVLGAKERDVLRPHGHLLRSGGSWQADESSLASTTWMGGVFHSMVTQGHVSINRLLSTCHSYLGLFRSHGQRVFAELGGEWRLLGIPSAFEMRQESCRWIYRHAGGVIEVVSSAPADRHELRLEITVLEGAPARFLISHHIALNGDDGSVPGAARMTVDGCSAWLQAVPDSDVGRRFPAGGFVVRADEATAIESIGGDGLLFADGISRNQPFLCFVTVPCRRTGLEIEGRLVPVERDQDGGFWDEIRTGLAIQASQDSPLAGAVARTCEIFPWFVHNALVHYLSPRGLEQYSGGGWGTRDVCQGPVELLLALGRFEPIRDLLLRVFRQQNADGDWPQWFMFFERERNIRPGDSHGDIVYWPLVALAQYLTATGDASLLEEALPYFHPDGDAMAETATVAAHVERALALIRRRVIPGTRLAAYGHGDWNDSLQPAVPEMRERLCSSWTVTLNYQTCLALAEAFRTIGQEARAAEFEAEAAAILAEFQQILVVDGVVTGLAYFHEDGKTDYLLHPRDTQTGLSYSLLPMIHAILNDLFDPDQAAAHLELIREKLSGPDGARLFDRPLRYDGGVKHLFQRAETASFFGREIGVMYTHAHLRYCEALARFGDAEGFFEALQRINPIGLREIVASATARQANCYYSSSDAAFADRYQAFDEYGRVNGGTVALEGGWRVYSSGAGIGTRLIVQCFLGLRIEAGALVIDPMIPSALDGLEVEIRLAGRRLRAIYQCGGRGCGVREIGLNGRPVEFRRDRNPYRTAGVRVELGLLAMDGAVDTLTVRLE